MSVASTATTVPDSALHLTFLSDWHVGTGIGQVGGVDASVHRDEHNLPFVPAKTVTGVWRDACFYVAEVLDGRGPLDVRADTPAPPPRWARWVDALFGTDQGVPALLAIGPARLPDDVTRVLRAYPLLAQALIARRPGVALDSFTGTAREDYLRLEERVAGDLTLTAEVRPLRSPDGLPPAAELLLRAGARLMDGLGGKRSRGVGRIRCRFGDAPADQAPDTVLRALLDDPLPLADPGDPPEPRTYRCDLPAGTREVDRAVHRVVLRVLTPLVVPDRLRGNLLTSHDRVLGTGLLPALLPFVRGAALALGDIRVGDALPAVQVGDDVVPAYTVPAVWHRPDKGRGRTVLDVSRTAPTPDQKARPATGRVARTGERTWIQVAVGRTDRTHAVIDREARRPVESAGGGLFTFQGIPAGTLLACDVVLPVDAWLEFSDKPRLRLGRSRKDDFGEVEVVRVDRLPQSPPPTVPAAGVGGGGPRTLAVWCVSDVLLRDERLAPDPSPQGLARELSRAFEQSGTAFRAISVTPDADGSGQLRPTVAAATRRDGFAVRWGRPRPTQVALAAGSVVRMAVTGPPPDPHLLARIERDGVGRRTAEGFGAVRFDPPELTTPDVTLAASAGRDRLPAQEHAADQDRDTTPWSATALLADLATSAWRAVIRRRVEELAATGALSKVLPGLTARRPSPSQLGQLRAQVERLGDRGAVKEWFDALMRSNTRSRTWSTGALPAARALLLQSTGPGSVWEHLRLDDAKQVAEAGLPPLGLIDPRTHLRHEAVALLVVALHRDARIGRAARPVVRPIPSGGSR